MNLIESHQREIDKTELARRVKLAKEMAGPFDKRDRVSLILEIMARREWQQKLIDELEERLAQQEAREAA